MRYAAIAVVVLVLIAGCSSVQTDDGPAPGTNATVTTATTSAGGGSTTDVSNETTEVTDGSAGTTTGTTDDGDGDDGNGDDQLAPGITESGIRNVSALLGAHRSALLEDGYVGTTVVEERYSGNLSDRTTQRYAVGPGGEFVHLEQHTARFTKNGQNSSVDVWMNATTTASMQESNGSSLTNARDRQISREATAWMSRSFADQLTRNAGQYEVVGVEQRNGTRVVTLEATIDAVGDDEEPDTNVTLVVTERGVVDRLEMVVHYDVSTITATYQVQRIGGVSPERPEWVENGSASGRLRAAVRTVR